MTSTTELLPCPFCGGSVSICVCIGDWYNENDEIDGDSYKWTIRHSDFHSKCDLRSFDVSGRYRTLDCAEANEQKQRLIAAWNTRAAHGTLTAEQVSKAVYAHSIHADCADADWQAIADELNAELGSEREKELEQLVRDMYEQWAYSIDGYYRGLLANYRERMVKLGVVSEC